MGVRSGSSTIVQSIEIAGRFFVGSTPCNGSLRLPFALDGRHRIRQGTVTRRCRDPRLPGCGARARGQCSPRARARPRPLQTAGRSTDFGAPPPPRKHEHLKRRGWRRSGRSRERLLRVPTSPSAKRTQISKFSPLGPTDSDLVDGRAAPSTSARQAAPAVQDP